MDTIKEAIEELNALAESSPNSFDKEWEAKFGPDDTVVMTPDQFFKEFREMRNFHASK